jgi:predicted nucleic acid-binding protein
MEYFINGPNSDKFEPVIVNTRELIVSTVNIYEVYKKTISQTDENMALEAVAMMQQARVIHVSPSIAIQAAKFSYIFKLPLADSIIYITARENYAMVWTMDADFKDLENVQYFE